jgi:hypothetical protein
MAKLINIIVLKCVFLCTRETKLEEFEKLLCFYLIDLQIMGVALKRSGGDEMKT